MHPGKEVQVDFAVISEGELLVARIADAVRSYAGRRLDVLAVVRIGELVDVLSLFVSLGPHRKTQLYTIIETHSVWTHAMLVSVQKKTS